MILLSSRVYGRDNNFNLIRMCAALIVLITHCFALTAGGRQFEPLIDTLGMTLGDIAVDVFFIISGFLVTASLLNRKSMIEFIWARILRIYPGLFAVLVLTVFVLGGAVTLLPLHDYYSSPQTYAYFVKNLLLVSGIEFSLPGVFETNPYAGVVNGSLWTIPYEVAMYACLVVALAMSGLLSRFLWHFAGLFGLSGDGRTDSFAKHKEMAFTFGVVCYGLISGAYVLLVTLYAGEWIRIVHLSFMFFVGASFYLLKDRIALSATVFWLFVAGLLVSVLNMYVFFVMYVFTLAYILFYIAYVPAGVVRKYNRLGDYSYGLYIYAFPVQQAIILMVPGISVMALLLCSGVVSIFFAVLSWHLLEKRALGLKVILAERTRALFGQGAATRASQI